MIFTTIVAHMYFRIPPGCCNGRQTFNRTKNALVLRVQPHLKELEQSSKAFPPKNTEKRPMGYAGISGLAKTVTLKPRKSHRQEDILSTDDAETLCL